MTSTSPGRLPDDTCDRDPIWDRELETASYEQAVARATAAWEKQLAYLRERSTYYMRRFREAGIGHARVGLKDMSRLPFSTKEELKHAIDDAPPFGSNLCVPPAQVKRVYQTSGTTGAPSVLALSRTDIETGTGIGTRTYFATGIHDHSSVLTTFGAGPFFAGPTHFVMPRTASPPAPVPPRDTDRVLFGLKAGLADTLLRTPSFAQYLANRLQ